MARGPDRYLLEDLASDLRTGHDVRATVFIQCGSAYRKDGPEEMRPVGETEFVAAIAAESESLPFQACAGIIGHADCRLGDKVEPVCWRYRGRWGAVQGNSAQRDLRRGIADGTSGAPPGLFLSTRHSARASPRPGNSG